MDIVKVKQCQFHWRLYVAGFVRFKKILVRNYFRSNEYNSLKVNDFVELVF